MAQAVGNALAPRWRPRKRLWLLLGMGLAGWAVYGALREWRNAHAFLINRTDSLPNWAFLIHRTKKPARGDYIFFTAPTNALVTRHFGASPPMFGKLVYGMPGDVVSHQGAVVRVNGRPVARMKARTRWGEVLTPGPTGVIPQDCYYVGTPHKDGFDSRYAEIGLVCVRQIIGTGEPVL
ncbi:S26 family signal peptidase [Sphingobium estronivorans]|uniref:S26 family signal peptidase n=1 Tax=Sphingobium estronivorans TaxID=1577690 RepID=UPI00123A0B5B|nr:S26 family signal peptidase [Sphingobium estronivorans]